MSCQSLKIIFIERIKLILIKVLFNSKSIVSLKKQIEIMKTEKNPKGAGRPSKNYAQKNLQKKVPLEMFRECIEALNVICKDYEKKHL
jgi:hypothetical protein